MVRDEHYGFVSHIHTVHTYIHTTRLKMWKEASVATVEREEKLSAAASALEHNLTLGAKISICVYVCT
jgi:hypothetical protein